MATIDERLEALTTNTELMSHMLKDVIERIDKLASVSERHEALWEQDARRWRKVMRIVQAALEAGSSDDDENDNEEQEK